jgi:hypothetical protein
MASERNNPRPDESQHGPARRVPSGGTYQPDKLAFEIPDDVLGEETDGGKLAKRLSIAFVLIAIIAIFNFVFLRKWEMDLAPEVLLGTFGVIFIASILPSFEAKPDLQNDDDSCDSDGCSVGCCQGPRPIGELSRKAAQRRNQMRLPTRHPKS